MIVEQLGQIRQFTLNALPQTQALLSTITNMNTQEITTRETELTPRQTIRGKIMLFEEKMKSIPNVKYGDMKECPLTHRFADNVYVREIFIPKDTLVVGKIHRHSHPNFLIKGEVSVVTETGGVERIKAPCSMISPAGTKRVVYTHEDTTWQTVHINPTNTQDLEKIEKEVIAKTYDDLSEDVKKQIEYISEEEQKSILIEFINEEK